MKVTILDIGGRLLIEPSGTSGHGGLLRRLLAQQAHYVIHNYQVFGGRDDAHRDRRVFGGDDGFAANVVALGVEDNSQRAQAGANLGA